MATAVSLRKGTTQEHEHFIGTPGEVTVDTDVATLYVHIENETSGTPLARADLNNVNRDNITRKGIATSDLTNVTIPADSISVVKANLAGLDYAQLDMSNVNTESLVAGGRHLGKNLAYADGTNINTNDLANIHRSASYGKALATTDLDNVTTNTIAGKLENLYANKNLDNVDTGDLASGRSGEGTDKDLMYADLTNVKQLTTTTLSDLYAKGIQLTSNLTQDLSYTTTNQYPTTKVVKEALDAIERIPTLPPYSEEPSLTMGGYFPYKYTLTITNAGAGYTTDSYITATNSSTGATFQIYVEEVDAQGGITTIRVVKQYGTSNLSGTVTATTGTTHAVFKVTSAATMRNKLDWNQPTPLVTDITIEENDGIVNVKISCVPHSIRIKTLLGGETVQGTWSTLSTDMYFEPVEPEDTLANAWIVTVD